MRGGHCVLDNVLHFTASTDPILICTADARESKGQSSVASTCSIPSSLCAWKKMKGHLCMHGTLVAVPTHPWPLKFKCYRAGGNEWTPGSGLPQEHLKIQCSHDRNVSSRTMARGAPSTSPLTEMLEDLMRRNKR